MTSFEKTRSMAEQIAEIRQKIPDSVRIIAVTKRVSVAAMREAYQVGIRDFGESKVQEASFKQSQLQDLNDITWHLIGHLQSNKASKALRQFQWIHSVDSLKLARRLNVLSEQQSLKPKVCLQVKLLPDPNKYGWSESQLLEDLSILQQFQQLQILGLMAIPPQGLTTSEIQVFFQRVRELGRKIRQQFWPQIQIQELSMGMSSDYQFAVQAGATMIRLGRVLFGDRT